MRLRGELKSDFMKKKLGLLLVSFLFASCTSAQPTTRTLLPTSTIIPLIQPTSTHISTLVPPTITNIPQPIVAPTSTSIDCDPFTADFCVTDEHLILQRPIHLPANN